MEKFKTFLPVAGVHEKAPPAEVYVFGSTLRLIAKKKPDPPEDIHFSFARKPINSTQVRNIANPWEGLSSDWEGILHIIFINHI